MKHKKKKEATLFTRADGPIGAEKFDPQGSYTGIPVIPEEKPVQDVDDL